MSSSRSSGSRSIIVIHRLAPPVARSATEARARTASEISRACSSISRSIRTRNRSSLPSKLEYRAPVENPALEAISSTEAPWKPLRANTLRAAASRRSRVFALLCSRGMRVAGSARPVPDRGVACAISIPQSYVQSVHYCDSVRYPYRRPIGAADGDRHPSLDGPQPGKPSDRRDLLLGPLRPLGARQLARHRARLHRGRPPVARGLHRVRAPGGPVELLPVLLGRGRGGRQPLALHRRGAPGGAEV